jgi:filamentous hemagglutinin family protein
MKQDRFILPLAGAIALTTTQLPAIGQVVPDNSLGAESSVVVPGQNINGLPSDRIDGGALRGGNLFHSFQEFNVGDGAGVYFSNPQGVDNIFGRVTGNNISNILGTLGVLGNANLFLVNPAGLVFGPNARLNVGGSFIGTTANSVIFDDGNFYSATNPNAPPLLTVNVPIGLQLSNPGEIQVTGNGNSGTFPDTLDGLAVSPGRTLALVGGDVTINGGIVAAESGRIEIGSAVAGEVSLTPAPVGWRLGYEGVGEFGEVRLSDRSSVWNFNSNTNSFPNSGIQIEGRRIVLEERSQIASVTEGSQPGGDILVNASETLEVGGGIDNVRPFASGIISRVEEGATGSGGAVIVSAPQLRLFDGGRISSLSFGDGDGGSVAVNAAESIFINGLAIGIDGEDFNSGIKSENYSAGSGGNITVSTGELNLLDGGQILSFVSPIATGNGGNINIFAAESVRARGTTLSNPIGASSGIFSATRGRGRGGNISLSTARLSLSQIASISSQTTGAGKGGDIIVNASESISATETYSPSANFSGIAASTLGPARGGSIAIFTGSFLVSEGADIGTAVIPPELIGGMPAAETGNAGNLTVNADTIEVIGISPLLPDNTTTFGSLTFGSGNAGDVTISTRRLTVRDGGSVASGILSSFLSFGQPLPNSGTGNGGNLTVNASEFIAAIGVDPFIGVPSNLGTFNFGSGNAGNARIETEKLIVRDGGTLNSVTGSTGNAGEIAINALEVLVEGVEAKTGTPADVSASAFIFINDSAQQALFLPQTPTGDTGQLTINTNRLTVRNGGRINVQHEGTGNAGTLQINAAELFLENGGSITAASASGRGGNVTLNVPTSLQLRGGSRITAEAGGSGDGGNLTVSAETIALLRNSNINANAFEGNGGNIAITTNGLFLSSGSAITASSQLGVDGTVKIQQFGANPGEIIVDFAGDRLDPSTLVTVGCEDYQNSEFIVTGRGGLPPNPTQPLTINTPLVEWAPPQENLSPQERPQTQYLREDTSSPPLVEATGWIVDERGKIILVANAPTATPTTGGLIHPGCR